MDYAIIIGSFFAIVVLFILWFMFCKNSDPLHLPRCGGIGCDKQYMCALFSEYTWEIAELEKSFYTMGFIIKVWERNLNKTGDYTCFMFRPKERNDG